MRVCLLVCYFFLKDRSCFYVMEKRWPQGLTTWFHACNFGESGLIIRQKSSITETTHLENMD